MSEELRTLLPLVAALLLIAVRESWTARRRLLANRALHEARRPLQAIALAMPADPASVASALPVWQAIRALGEVDRQINGGAPDRLPPEPIACRAMLDACASTWRSRARMRGGDLRLVWTGPDAVVEGDPALLSAAVENLILNAIEHGGPEIEIRALALGRRLRIEIGDDGAGDPVPRSDGSTPGRRGPRRPGRIGGARRDRRRGHGLEIVRRSVREHGGKFDLKLDRDGSRASIVLPCSAGPAGPGRRRSFEDRASG